MKNRISAQSARDRKKSKMNDLQEQLAALSEERKQMQKENELLMKRNLKLEMENNELRNRLNSSDEDSVNENCFNGVKRIRFEMNNEDNLSIEPAEV